MAGSGYLDPQLSHQTSTQATSPTTTAGPVSRGTSSTAQPWNGYITPHDLDKIISGLSTSQVENPQKSLIDALSASIGKLDTKDSAGVEKLLAGEGGPLAGDVTSALQGTPPGGKTANPYGFDPLSFGEFFKSTLGPYLQSVNKQDQGLIGGEQAQMAKALEGASPQLKAAYQATEPGMAEAQALESKSQAGLAFGSPMFDALISNLQAATTGAKAAQTQAAEEPYIAQAVTGIGSPTNAVGAGQSAANMAAIYQAALQNLATNSQGALPNPASTNPQTALGAASNPLANLLPGMAAPAA